MSSPTGACVDIADDGPVSIDVALRPHRPVQDRARRAVAPALPARLRDALGRPGCLDPAIARALPATSPTSSWWPAIAGPRPASVAPRAWPRVRDRRPDVARGRDPRGDHLPSSRKSGHRFGHAPTWSSPMSSRCARRPRSRTRASMRRSATIAQTLQPACCLRRSRTSLAGDRARFPGRRARQRGRRRLLRPVPDPAALVRGHRRRLRQGRRGRRADRAGPLHDPRRARGDRSPAAILRWLNEAMLRRARRRFVHARVRAAPRWTRARAPDARLRRPPAATRCFARRPLEGSASRARCSAFAETRLAEHRLGSPPATARALHRRR